MKISACSDSAYQVCVVDDDKGWGACFTQDGPGRPSLGDAPDNGFDAEEHVQAEPEASAEILSAFELTPLDREY